MRNVGFIASSVSHVLILSWGLVSLPAPKTHDVTPLEILPVDLVTLADVTDVKKGDSKGMVQEKIQEEVKKAPEPVKEEPKKPAPKVQPKVQETEAKPKSEPAPKVEPKPEPVKKAEPKPEPTPVKKAEPKVEPKVEEKKPEAPKAIAALPKIKPKPPKKKAPPKKVAQKQPAKKKRDFDANALKALVNKADEAAPQKTASEAKKASFGSRTGKQAAAMTQSEIDSLRAQVSECWSPPAGAVDAGELRIRLQFRMDRSGNVVGQPEILAGPPGSFGYAASRAAVRAVMRCAPYQLPADKYDLWKDTILNFDPSDMF